MEIFGKFVGSAIEVRTEKNTAAPKPHCTEIEPKPLGGIKLK